MIRVSAAALVFCCLATSTADAQTACPVGVAPGSPQCGPSPPSHGAYPPRAVEPQIRYVLTGEWIKTWGAIAVDGNANVGLSSGRLSEQEAKRDALTSCNAKGHGKCIVLNAYRNQCVALAWPNVPGYSAAAANGLTELLANLEADRLCELNKVQCRTVYTNCSDSVYRKF